ncbi:MAG: hypothetical protein NZM25_00795 [Leptospiraceae bacterium]|nr:hypothetical protein [Leptospiraceae bacterium]MDW8306263.1 hypothetical protein [Leptospiraceae bacterium]
MRFALNILFLVLSPILAVDLGTIELKLNGQTKVLAGLMATLVEKNGEQKLMLGLTDEAARTKLNVVIKLQGELQSHNTYDSLHHEVLFTLREPGSGMLIMPRYQSVKTVFREVETDLSDPEGYESALLMRREKPLFAMSPEERKEYEEKMRQNAQKIKPRRFQIREAEYGKLDFSARVERGIGIQENPGQEGNAIFVRFEPVYDGTGNLTEIKGSLSGYARGKGGRRWELAISPFRAIFIDSSP